MPPTLRRLVGRVAWRVLPGLAREVESGANTGRFPRLKSAMIEARLHRAVRKGEVGDLQSVLAAGWRGAFGDSFHGAQAEGRLKRTIEQHGGALAALRSFLDSGRYSRLVELGCGEGQALRHVMAATPPSVLAVGIDLNDGAIGRARAVQAGDARLSFEVGDGTEWLGRNPQSGTILFTNGGVLEYVAPDGVDSLLRALRAALPSAVVFIEPLDPAHDLDRDPNSRIFGVEQSFSHNYPARIQAAGFRIVHRSEVLFEGIRWVLLAAEAD
jgi:SAM-dependent methyltransferase